MDHDIAATATMHPAFATSLASLSEEGAGNCTENPMLWNWNTIGTCFISKAWHIDSGGKFGITCVGAFMLVMILEFLARVSREWERHRFARSAPNSQGPYAPAAGIELAVLQPAAPQPAAPQPAAPQPAAPQPAAPQPAAPQPAAPQPAAPQPAAPQPAAPQPDDIQPDDIQPVASRPASATGPNNGKDASDANNDANPIPNFCPSFVEHAFIKALLHTVQCIITYILILMAVSFNGYIIISMFIGAYVGALCFQRDPMAETRNPNAYQRAFQQPVVCCV
ncbi:Ctr copper transporter family-domain-containing protein [Fusarium sp. MPI-SDFR-AT-0072]|nr:Ctr copper transporter family-domain-containing protein [Fusarium sp. MPI-SDFR-AT-0072]